MSVQWDTTQTEWMECDLDGHVGLFSQIVTDLTNEQLVF